MERREFVKGSLAAVMVLGFSPEHLLGAEVGSRKGGQAWFEARQGTGFRIVGTGGRRTRVRLAEVRPYPSAGELEQFDVVLRGAVGTVEEGTYAVLPEDGDPLLLFLQPSGEGALTASFSLLQ